MGRAVLEVIPSEELTERAQEIMTDLIAGRSWSGEFTVRRKDGTTFPAMVTDTPVRDEQGNLLAIIGVSTDITELKETEELRRSEKRFRSLVQNASDIITLLTAEGTVSYVSPAIEQVLGYRPEERVGNSAFELVHPDDLPRAREALAESLRSPGVPLSIELRMRHRDGSWRYLEVTGMNLLDDPSVGTLVLNSRDITKRKEAEEALEESERRYARLLSNTRAYVYRCLNEPGWPNEFASDYALELTGYPPEDLITGGKIKFGDLIVEEDRQRVWDEVQAALAQREHFKLRYTIHHGDGTPRHVEEYGQGIYDEEGNVVALEGLLYDVTELKRAEDRLKEAEERYRTLVESIPAVTYIQEATGAAAVQYVSPQMEDMLGYSLEECTSDPDLWVRILHPADRERVLAEDQRTNETGEPFRMEYRQFAKDGRVVWIRDEATLVHDEKGTPSYWLGIQYDITERKHAENALKESELRLRSVITNVPVILFALDHSGTFTLSEGKGLDILGLEPGEAVGRSVSELYGERPEILEDVDRALAGEEFSAVREVGTRTFETWYSPLRAGTGEIRGAIGVAADVTERKEAEQRLQEANRHLEELAVLKADFTAMVAHELDTPLAVIRGYADMLATGEVELAEQSRALDKIQAETDLLEALVSDVRAAATVEREDFAVKPRPVSVGALLKDAATFAETLPGNHRLNTAIMAGGQVRVDPYRIGQVLRNLLSNAAKYSPEGAPIELRAVPGEKPGRVRIEVADQGASIHPDDVERIFEKFGRGRDESGRKAAGVGLGLYLSRRILQAHGSELTLDRASGGGSVFGFELGAVQ
jgi:PAS domain S-box-containing protein